MRVVLCNCPPDLAPELARTLVQEELAACVNLLPVRSVYLWDGALQDEPEVTLVIKVALNKLLRMNQRIRELHPYDTVEILALKVDEMFSDPRYLAWVSGFALEGSDG